VRKLSDVASVIPAHHRVVVPLKAWLTFVRVFSLVIITQFLLWITPSEPIWWLVKVPLIFLAGLAFVGIFVLGHDCGHYAFSRKRWVNDVVGTLCHLPIMNGFFAWRLAHDYHHRNRQIRKHDPDWPELLYRENEDVPWHQKLAVKLGPGSPVGLFVGFWVGMVKRAFFGLFIPQMKVNTGDKWRVYLHSIFSAAAVFFMLRFYYQTLGFEKFLEMYVAPAFVGTTFGALLTFMHHSHEGSPVFDREGYDPYLAQVEGTWNVRFPRWMEWMWLDINIHLPHHVIPGLPWYHLRSATEDIRAQFPEVVKEKVWSLKTMQESWRAVDLKESAVGIYSLKSR